MRTIRIHGPIFLLLQALTFACFGRLMGTPIWNGMDGDILCDAHALSQDPLDMLGHLGFYFSQPLLQLAFLGEYHVFGLNTAGYIAVNLFIHACNAFIVYMLVNMLFPRKSMALLAAGLFALGVGSYGKSFMGIYQLETVLLGCLHMLVLYFFIRNDFRYGGRLLSSFFLLGLSLYLLSGLAKTTSFSLLCSLATYKFFFKPWRRGRVILEPDILVIAAVAILFFVAQNSWGYHHPTIFYTPETERYFSLLSVKNLFRYLTLMLFPIQQSPILEAVPRWLLLIFAAAPVIRIFLTLAIVSYSFFGFIFGGKAIRFFIAWTYISLLPFTGQTASGVWLNLSHLYLTSLGFCVILAAGVEGTSALLKARPRARAAPYLVPLVFVAISLTLIYKLDDSYRIKAAQEQAVQMRENIALECR